MIDDRQPPAAVESERSVLATILENGKTEQQVRECLDLLSVESFYLQSHREIFDAIVTLESIDYVLVMEYLQGLHRRQGESFDLGYYIQLKQMPSSIRNLPVHTNKVLQKATQRQLIAMSYQVAELGYQDSEPAEILDYIQTQISSVESSTSYEPRSLSDCMKGYVDILDKRCKGDSSIVGIKTGIIDLDRQIIGVGNTWLFVLAGRPSHGKSLVAQMIANNISREAPTMFFSLEMSELEIVDRFICLEAGIADKEIRTGLFSDDGYARTANSMKEVKDGVIRQYIDTTPALSLNQIRTRAKKAKKLYPDLGMIQVDYLGLMQTDKKERNDIAIGEVTRGLKQLSKEIEVPIMLLVQCNRKGDSQERYKMSNLADSASIERDADLVLFTHRDDVDNPDSNKAGIIELQSAKFRHGTIKRDVFMQKDLHTKRYVCIDGTEFKNDKPKEKGFSLD